MFSLNSKHLQFIITKKTVIFFLLFALFISIQNSNSTEKLNEIKTGYTGSYKFRAEGKDLFILSVVEYKSGANSLLKITQKQTFRQPKSNSYLTYFNGTFAWASKYKSYVFYYSGQRKRFCQLKIINGKLVASIHELRRESPVRLDGLGSFKKIVNSRNQRTSYNTNSSNTRFGPNVKGKYLLKNNEKEVFAAFKVTQSGANVFVEEDTNSEEEFVDFPAGAKIKEALKGTFRWDSNKGSYRKNTALDDRSGYVELHGGNPSFLGVRKSLGYNGTSSHWASLQKVQGSLSDLGNSIKNNVSGITGNWTVENSNVSLTFTAGVDNDLLIRYGSKVYELNKLDGNVIESYQGTSRNGEDEIIVKIISGTKMQLDLGDTKLNAYRKNGSNYSRNTSNNSTNKTSTTNNSMDSKLLIAISKNDETSVEEVLNLGGSANAKNTSGSSALHEAVLKNSSSMVEALLAKGANINVQNGQGRTPLDLATQKMTSDNGEMVTLLLDKNATLSNYAIDKIINKDNVELIDKVVETANSGFITNKAIEKGKVSLFRKMIEEKGVTISPRMFDKALSLRKYPIADVMISSGFDANYAISSSAKNNVTDLVYTAMQAGGNADIALKYAVKKRDNELLLEAIDKYSANPTTGIKLAIDSKNISMITTLLDKGADANKEFSNVAISGNTQILKLLIDKDADINLGVVPAAEAKKNNVVKLLLEAGADANKVLPILVSQGNTELTNLAITSGASGKDPKLIQSAARKGYDEIVVILLKAGADANKVLPIVIAQGNKELTTLAITSGAKAEDPKLIHSATINGFNDIVLLLIEAGANPNDGVKLAVANNKPTILKTLVEANAKVDDKNLLIASVKHNNTILTGILLKNGADPQDALNPAVKSNAHKVLKQLITAGVEVTEQSLLNHSVAKNYTQCAILLINENLEANSITSGYTLLHIAVKNKNYTLVKALLDAKADANAVSQGDAPLHLAVRNRREVSIVDALIKSGADVNAKDSKGKKVLRIAKGSKIKRLLKNNGGVKK